VNGIQNTVFYAVAAGVLGFKPGQSPALRRNKKRGAFHHVSYAQHAPGNPDTVVLYVEKLKKCRPLFSIVTFISEAYSTGELYLRPAARENHILLKYVWDGRTKNKRTPRRMKRFLERPIQCAGKMMAIRRRDTRLHPK
jgi:hypothetical protein